MSVYYPSISFYGTNNVTPVQKNQVNSDINCKLLKKVKIGTDTATFYELKNGHKVIIFPCKGKSRVQTIANVGSFNEPDNLRGISHFIEHTIISGGSKNLTPNEAWNVAQDTAADMNAATSMSKTGFYFSSYLFDDEDLEKQIKTQAQIVKNPIFRQDRLNNEKNAVKEEILMYEKDDIKRALEVSMANLLGIKTQDDLIGGNTGNINNLKREDIVDFYQKHYKPDDLVTVVSGDIKENEALKLVDKYFGSDEKANSVGQKYYQPINPIQKTVKREFKVKTILPKNIVFNSFMGLNTPEEKIYVELLDRILNRPGSEVFKETQKNGSTLKLDIGNAGNDNHSVSVVMAISRADSNHEKDFEKALQKELNKIKNGNISHSEFETIKKKFLYDTKRATSDGNKGEMLSTLLYHDNPESALKYLSERDKILENVKMKDLSDYAEKYLDFDKVSVVKLTSAKSGETPQKVSLGKSRNVKLDYGEIKTSTLSNNILFNEKKTDSAGVDLSLSIRKNTTERKLPDNPLLNDVLQSLIVQTLQNNKEAYDKLSMNFELITDGYETTADMNCPEKNARKATKLVTEFMVNPKFRKKDFENVKSIIKASLDTMIKINKPDINDAKDFILFPNSSTSLTPKKALEYLNQLTFEDMQNAYENLIQNSDCVTSVATETKEGAVEIKDCLEKLPKFDKFETKDNISLNYGFEPLEKEVTAGIKDENSKKAEIVQYFKYPELTEEKDKLTVLTINTILSGLGIENSRLLKDFRENKGMCYSVRSLTDKYGKNDVLAFKISTSTDGANGGTLKNVSKSLNGFKEHINKLCNEEVGDDELKFAKNMIKKKIFDLNSSEYQRISEMTSGFRHKNGSYDFNNSILKLTDSITKEDIKRVSNVIFNSSKPLNIVKADPVTLNMLGIKTFEYDD